MRAARESSVKDAVVKRVRGSGRWCRRIPGTAFQSGLPDILVHLLHPPGRALWLEVKQPGNHPTKLQAATIAEINQSGALASVVYSAEEAMCAIEQAEACWRPTRSA